MMTIIEKEDGFGRDAIERAVGNPWSARGLRCEGEVSCVTRSEFEYELLEMRGETVGSVVERAA